MKLDPELTKGEVVYISNKMSNAFRKVKDTCIDNLRLCAGTEVSEEYIKQKSNGCCGFKDIKIELKNGKVFYFGFNFGH